MPPEPIPLNTPRLQLINCNSIILAKLAESDQALAAYLDVQTPERWTEYGAPIFEYTTQRLKEHPEDQRWWSWLPVVKEGRVLTGSCGYKGAPDANGMVEIGYEISEVNQGKGYATELAQALVDHVFSHSNVHYVQAHTLAQENASVNVLRKCGFQQLGEVMDEEDGLLWKWVKVRDGIED